MSASHTIRGWLPYLLLTSNLDRASRLLPVIHLSMNWLQSYCLRINRLVFCHLRVSRLQVYFLHMNRLSCPRMNRLNCLRMNRLNYLRMNRLSVIRLCMNQLRVYREKCL